MQSRRKSPTKKKILIIGGNGFVGKYLSYFLKKNIAYIKFQEVRNLTL